MGEASGCLFFGKPAYTMTLAARLTETGRPSSSPSGASARGAGYRMHLRGPQFPIEGSLEERATAINREIEALIRSCPGSICGATTATSDRVASSRRRRCPGGCVMQLAFCLYKYFPHGGLQRDFMRIALACRSVVMPSASIRWNGVGRCRPASRC